MTRRAALLSFALALGACHSGTYTLPVADASSAAPDIGSAPGADAHVTTPAEVASAPDVPPAADTGVADVHVVKEVQDASAIDVGPAEDSAAESETSPPPCVEGAACDDGDACTSGDTCAGGVCHGGLVDCSDGNPCTADFCLPSVGCLKAPGSDGTPCSSGVPCTAPASCQLGVCTPGADLCDDQLSCTQDACIDGSCVHTGPTNACLIDGVCYAAGELVAGGPCLACAPYTNPTAGTFQSPCLYYGPADVAALQQRAYGGETSPAGVDWSSFFFGADSTAIGWLGAAPYSFAMGGFSYVMGPTMPAPHADAVPYWTDMLRDDVKGSITNRMDSLTLGYLETSDFSCLDGAIALAEQLCQWPQWSDPSVPCLPGPTCLDTAYAASSVAYVLDASRVVMAPYDHATLAQCLLTLGATPLAVAVQAGLDAGTTELHPFALAASSLTVTAAALYAEASAPNPVLEPGQLATAAAWLDLGLAGATAWLAKQPQDGGLVEGHRYGAWATDHVVRALVVAERFGKGAVESPYLDHLPEAWWAQLAPGNATVAPIGDATKAPLFGETAAYLAARGSALASAWLEQTGLAALPDFAVPVAWAHLASGAAPVAPTATTWASTAAGVASLRSGWSSTDLLALLKAGPPATLAPGNHLDTGSVVLAANGEWLLGDPGLRSTDTADLETFTTGTEGHSTWLIDGEGQDSVVGGLLAGPVAAGGASAACGDLLGAYDAPLMAGMERCVLVLDAETAVIVDRAAQWAPHDVSLLFQPDAAGTASLIGGSGWIEAETHGVLLTSSLSMPPTVEPPWHDVPGFPDHLALHAAATGGDWVGVHLLDVRPVPWGVRNPGFEQGLARWTATPPWGVDVLTQGCPGSGTCATVTSSSLTSAPVDVKPGDAIVGTAAVVTAGAALARLKLAFDSGEVVSPWASAAGGAATLELSGVAPSDATRMRLVLEVTGGTAWFDDATLTSPQHPSSPVAPPLVLERTSNGLSLATDGGGTLTLCAARWSDHAGDCGDVHVQGDLALLETDAQGLRLLVLTGVTSPSSVAAAMATAALGTPGLLRVVRDGATLAIDASKGLPFTLNVGAPGVTLVTLNGAPAPFESSDDHVFVKNE